MTSPGFTKWSISNLAQAVLIALKMGVDLRGHWAERKRFGSTGVPTGSNPEMAET
jgi:hypothetical protein